MRATIEDLIKDFNDVANRKNPRLPFDLYEGIRDIIDTFGGKASDAGKFFEEYRRTRHIDKI
jgi:hypothetical protein